MDKNNKIRKYLPYVLLLAGAIILLARAYYSFCWSDETFYSSTAYRFLLGDRVFRDDWFPTQLSGIIILPFIAVYRLIVGSMTGVILYLRICYVLVSYGFACLTFCILRKCRDELIAYICSFLMLFYTHLNIATLSYYTISVECFLMAMLAIYHYLKCGNKARLVGSGVLFAMSVLALPTMAIAYVLLIMVILILRIVGHFQKSHKIEDKLKSLHISRIFLYTFSGIAIPLAVFLIFMIGNVSLADFIKGIPYVLSDDEHGTSLIFPLRKFFLSINEVYHKGAYLAYLLICASLILRKKLVKKPFKQIVFVFDVLIFVINAIYSVGHTGYVMTAFILFALPLYILTSKEHRDRKLFHTVFLGGLLFSLVYSYSSNGFLYVLSMGHFIAAIAGVAMTFDFAREVAAGEGANSGSVSDTKDRKGVSGPGKVIYGACVAIAVYVLGTTCYLRIVNVYRDAPLSQLTVTITQGPAKGLKTTAEHEKLYNEVYETIATECQGEGNRFISRLLPFGYMCTEMRVAAPTSWRINVNSTRLEEYYELNPEKLPDKVLILKEHYGTYDTCGDVEYDPNPNVNEMGGFLEAYLQENSYSCKDVPCGVLYSR